jgi:ELWxxDGT repeat protein
LWGTDGTEAGTRCLKDIGPGSRQAYHRFLGVAGTRLFFAADDYVHGSEMWVSDGTEAGTYLVKDIAPGNTSSGPVNMTNHNGVLFFYASDTVGMTGHGTELWKSDGTEAGTVMVKDISPGPESTDFFFSGLQSRDAFDLNGRIFFTAADRTGAYPGKFGRELYITDGTEGGTSLVKDIWPGTGGSSVRFVCIENNRLIFRADDFLHGEELWSSDGTPSGTVLLKDINLGESDTKITVLAHTNGWLFFTAYDPVNQGALWKSDGTEAGTQPLKSHIVYPDTISSFFVSPVYYDSQLYFVAGTEATGYELCVTDGTQEGTKVVDEVHPGNSSGVLGGSLFNLGDAIYFAAGDGIHGEELWIHEPALFRVRLKNPKLMTAGRIQFEIESTAKGTVHIQRSSDTRNWTPVDQVIVTDLSKPLTWSETPRIEGTGLFYRALLEW